MSIWGQIGLWIGIGIWLLVLLFICLGIRRWKKCKKKVCRMQLVEKLELLNELTEPLGFYYDIWEDVFSSHRDAWQRSSGYRAAYDKAAAGAGMVIDAWPVYFDYAKKTWLVEFWKGQYGINMGAEVGIYHADERIPPHAYRVTHFKAAEDGELPVICCCLERKSEKIYEFCEKHWWLTGFRMGTFSKPSDLTLFATLRFDEPEMARAFFAGLKKSGKPRSKYWLRGREVAVRMDFSPSYPAVVRVHRRLVQWGNHFCCKCYVRITKPFTETADRMIFLYYLLPGCFGKMMRLASVHYRKR